jgi:ABC-type oligopeptide transport system substrate-binding subunit
MRQQLVCATLATAGTLDPAKSGDFLVEGSILRALFEGLTNYHPQTTEPMAGLATHYETSADGMHITLYLRGHSRPRGAALPSTEALRIEYLNGSVATDLTQGYGIPSSGVPARWSDGVPITAHDVVYSWRRAVVPETAAPYAYLFYYIRNAQAVNAGRVRPDQLGARELDEFTLQVDLRAPTAFFLRLLSCPAFFPVPRHTIEAARKAGREDQWTKPELIVTSGAFALREWKPRDKIVLVRNPRYIEAEIVGLEGISFILVPDPTVGANLYKSGGAHFITAAAIPPLVAPGLNGKRDLCKVRAFGTFFPCFNTRKPPFDSVLVRYAFNMATDKQAVASLFGFGRAAARTLVPPLKGYKPPESVLVEVEGEQYDVLAYNPRGARFMLAKAGYPDGLDPQGRRLRVDLLGTNSTDILHCEILQQQWRTNLGVEVNIAIQEFGAWIQNVLSGNYRGITMYADWGFYLDPNWFLDQFVSGSSVNVSGWTDPEYDEMLEKANGTLDPAARMERLTGCERRLLRAMPVFPEYYDVWAYPQKPYVRGISPNVMDVHPLKFAWIDTNWRPS